MVSRLVYVVLVRAHAVGLWIGHVGSPLALIHDFSRSCVLICVLMRAHTNSRITRYAPTNDSKDMAAFAGLVEGREIQARDSLVERLAES